MMNRLLELWRQPIVYRTAIGLYVTLVLVLAGIIFSVDNLDVETAVYLRADSTLETDRTHGARGALQYAPTGEITVPESIDWSLVPVGAEGDSAERRQLEFPRGRPAEAWPTPTFRVPDGIEEGTYDLRFEATHEEIDTLETTTRVEVRRRPPVARSFDELRWPRPDLRDPEARPGRVVDRIESGEPADDEGRRIELAVAPSTGELMRGLDQQLVFRTRDAETGRPVPADIELEATSGMAGELASTLETDETGVGAITIRPTTSIELEADVDPVENPHGEGGKWNSARFDLEFRAVATQYALRPASRVVTPGDEIEATVQGTLPDGTFRADLFDAEGDRFIDAHSLMMTDGEGGIRFEAPDPEAHSLLLRLQTYQSLYGTSHAWDSGYVLLLEDDSTDRLREVTRELLTWVADETDSPHYRYLVEEGIVDDASEDELRELLDAGLEEIPRTMKLPPVLMNTRDADREALDEWSEEIKGDLQLMIGILVAVGIIVVLYFVLVGIRRYRRDQAMLEELAVEEADPMAEEKRKEARLERWVVVLQGLIVLSTLIAFAIGILMMVSYL